MIGLLLSMAGNKQKALFGIGIAIVAGLLAFGVQTYRLAAERYEHAVTRAEYAQTVAEHQEYLAGLERAAREAEALARAEEQRRFAALQGAVDEAEQRLEAARADAADATAAGDRLRQRINQLAAACRAGTGNSGAAGAGQAADATADMLANVQRRLDEATNAIAGYADRARTAGAACERSYDALNR